MSSNRPFRSLAAVGTAIALALVASPAVAARPPAKPGAVTNLAASATKPGASYVINSTWKAGVRTTSYAVRLTNSAGTVLDSGRVTAAHWSATTSSKAGTLVKVSVTPYNGTRKGATAAKSLTLPDLTAPTATFVASSDHFEGTLTQTALADDVSAPANIVRQVNWGDGSSDQAWPTGSTTLTHAFPAQGRYIVSVSMTDQAGNVATRDVPFLIEDTAAPTGAYTAGPAKVWAKYTKVQLTESTVVDDDWSPAGFITRTATWGDGTTTTTHSVTGLAHVYRTAGTFHPSVVLTDEAGNSSAALPAGDVVVLRDATAPKVSLRLPTVPRNVVHKWTTLRGKVVDSGTGARAVRIVAIQKRGSYFWAYHPLKHSWSKVGRTAAGAYSHAGMQVVVPTRYGNWAGHLYHLHTGTLYYRVSGVDHVLNVSKVLSHSQSLTRY